MPDTSLLPTPSSPEEVKTRHQQWQDLLRRLDSTQKSISAQAIDECRNLTAFEIRALLRMADAPLHARKPLHIRRRIGIATLLVLALIFLILLYLSYSNDNAAIILIFPILCMIGAVFLAAYTGRELYSVRLRQNLAIIISNAQDPALLPEAMRILYVSWPQAQTHTRLERALYDRAAHFLLTLDIEQIRRYNIQQQAFYIYLSNTTIWSSPEISIRVLNILEEIATPSAIPIVTPITRYVSIRPSEPQKRVRAAAQSCLHALHQRARENSQSQTLLRGSVAPADTAAVLLRPADAQVSQSEPDRLLRPANTMQSKPPISGRIINGNSET